MPIIQKHEHRILGLALIVLHLTLWLDSSALISRVLLLAHFALIILWQPFWYKNNTVELKSILYFTASVSIFIFFITYG